MSVVHGKCGRCCHRPSPAGPLTHPKPPLPPCRRGLLAEGEESWGPVTVRNKCPHRVALKAAYALVPGVDEGKPCPSPSPQGSCSTDWVMLG